MSSRVRGDLDEHIDRSRRLELVQAARTSGILSKTRGVYTVVEEDEAPRNRRRPMSAKIRSRRENNADNTRPRSARERLVDFSADSDSEGGQERLRRSHSVRSNNTSRSRRPMSATTRSHGSRVNHKDLPRDLVKSQALLDEARVYLKKRSSSIEASSAVNSFQTTPKKSGRKKFSSPRKGSNTARKMKRPQSAVALSKHGLKRRRPQSAAVRKSASATGLLVAARGRIGKTRGPPRIDRVHITQCVEDALLGVASVLGLGKIKVQVTGNREVVVDAHVLVDRRTSVKEAHKIATRARKSAMQSNTSIFDVIVHVDAETRSSYSGRDTADIEEDICNALSTVKEISSVAQVEIRRSGSRARANVEILVNPDLRMREVHYVARRARKIVEDIRDVDEAEIHLELAENEDLESKRRSQARTGTQSDKIVNATYMKSSKSPQTTTDEDSLSCGDSDTLKRRMPSARPPPVDTSQAEEDDYDEEEFEPVHTPSSRLEQASPVRQSRKLDPKQEEDALAYISPERKYTPVSADEMITPSRSNKDAFNRFSPTKAMSPASLSNSARQNARSQRIAGITRDPRLRQILRRINEHVLRSVEYRRFKYEKRLVAIGTALADMDRGGRGALSGSEFVSGLSGLDVGLTSAELENFVKILVGEKDFSEDRHVVRYADVIDALRKLQRMDADGTGASSTEDEEAQRDALSKYREYRNKIETAKAEPSNGESSPVRSTRVSATADQAAGHNPPVPTNKHLSNAQNAALGMKETIPSPLLTHAEKAQRSLEAKMQELQTEQQVSLESAQAKLLAEKKAFMEREAAFELEKQIQLEQLKKEKKAAEEEKARIQRESEEREKKLEEERMREKLKQEWLAREQAQQKRLELEKEKRRQDEEEEKRRIEREKAALEKSRADMEQAKRDWEKQRLEDERKREEKAEKEKLQEEKKQLERALEEEKQRADEEKLKWEKEQALKVDEARKAEEQKRIEQERLAREEHAELLKNEREAQAKLSRRMEDLEARLAVEEAEKKAIFAEQERFKERQLLEMKERENEMERQAAERIQAVAMEAKKAMEAKAAYEEEMRKEKETLEAAMAEAQKARDAENEAREKAEQIAIEERLQMETRMKQREEESLKERQQLEEKLRRDLENEFRENARRVAEEEAEAKLKAERERVAEEMASREKDIADEAKRKLEAAQQKLKEEKEELKRVIMEKDEQAKALLAEKLRVEQMVEKAKQVVDGERTELSVSLAPVPDKEETTPQVEHSASVRQTLFVDEPMTTIPSGDEKEASLSTSLRARRLSKMISVDTDTADDFDSEMDTVGEDNGTTDRTSNEIVSLDTTARTSRGGETDRELASGDTFDEHSFMPMQGYNVHHPLHNGQKQWEPIATPQGKNLYWYNWSSGESQWEKPVELTGDFNEHAKVLQTGTPTKKSAELWNILLARSSTVRELGSWKEMVDNQTQEHFYYNPSTGISQWEPPKDSDDVSEDMKTPLKERTVWEGIATPMGRNLYYYNWKTGESSWDKPAELKTPEGKHKKARILPSTPKAEDEGTSKQLWSILVNRSDTVKTIGDWAEMLDKQTNERFYYNRHSGTSQWEAPQSFAAPGVQPRPLNSPKSSSPPVAKKDGRRWEPITTPKGKNLYFYDWHTGQSQWERPDELKSPGNDTTHVLPSNSSVNTMSELSESQQLWDSLRTRSKTARIQGDWLEMVDPHSQEVFYYNTASGSSQWEMPSLPGHWGPAHVASHNMPRSDVWEPVMTPKGRVLYYYNKTTGAAQRKIPEGFDAHTSSQGEHLPSTPASADVPRAKRLWKVVLNRSRVIATSGGWAKMLDDATQEEFYHHSGEGISQWEAPHGFIASAQNVSYGTGSPEVPKQTRWQPVATPMGKNLYFWNSETGESQWEKPAELEQGVDTVTNPGGVVEPIQNEVLPSSASASNSVKAKKMWQVLRSRSKEIRVEGDWSEFLDEQTGERFFYNSRSGLSQWEMPEIMKGAQTSLGSNADSSSYMIDI
jgi:hypothetical protein